MNPLKKKSNNLQLTCRPRKLPLFQLVLPKDSQPGVTHAPMRKPNFQPTCKYQEMLAHPKLSSKGHSSKTHQTATSVPDKTNEVDLKSYKRSLMWNKKNPKFPKVVRKCWRSKVVGLARKGSLIEVQQMNSTLWRNKGHK